MAAAKWVHPIDQHGKVRAFEDIPNHLVEGLASGSSA
jgi:hypothetical protein